MAMAITTAMVSCSKSSTSTGSSVIPPSNPISTDSIAGPFVKGTLLTGTGQTHLNFRNFLIIPVDFKKIFNRKLQFR